MADDGVRQPGRRTPEDHVWVVLGACFVVSVVIALLVLVAWAIRSGFTGLSIEGTAGSFRDVVGDILFLTVTSGLLATAVTEFVKRQSGLRAWFHRRRVRAFLGAAVGLQTTRLVSRDNDVAGTAATARPITTLATIPPVSPTFDAPLAQVCAQLALYLAYLAAGVASRSFDPAAAKHAIAALLGTSDPRHGAWPEWLRIRIGDPATDSSVLLNDQESAPDEQVADELMRRAEQRLDAFQLQTTAAWRWLLRSVSSVAAGGFLLCAGIAVEADGVTRSIGFLLGLVVGGPVSWAARDLVRVLERKAG